MFKSQLNRTIEWTKENCPRTALLDSAEIRGIAKKALNDTSPIRWGLSIAGAIGGLAAGHWLTGIWFEHPYPKWEYGFTIGGCAAAVTAVTAFASEVLLRNKIESIVDGT